MERTIKISKEQARALYENPDFKDLALQAFDEHDLITFDDITTFEEALHYYCINDELKFVKIRNKVRELEVNYNLTTVAIYKLSIIKKVLNAGYELFFDRNPHGDLWYPCFRFVPCGNNALQHKIDDGTLTKVGSIGNKYDILTGVCPVTFSGLGCFSTPSNIGTAVTSVGLLGCATEEIARHFGRYFYKEILAVLYGGTEIRHYL